MKHSGILAITSIICFMLAISVCSCNKMEEATPTDKDEILLIPDNTVPPVADPTPELLRAHQSHKCIDDIRHMVHDSTAVTRIRFSDSTYLDFTSRLDPEGKDIVLHIITDDEKYWKASYDFGRTFKLLSGKDKKLISADYSSGYALKTLVTEEGFHAISKSVRNNTNVLETIVTEYRKGGQNPISAIIEDKEFQRVIISLADGTSLMFDMYRVHPQGIVVLTDEVRIKNGFTAEIEFRLNPSDSYIHIKHVVLDQITVGTRASGSYTNTPKNITLKGLRNATSKSGSILTGQYILTIQDLGKIDTYSDKIAIVISHTDAYGKTVNISSSPFTVTAEPPSSLPRVYITTPGGSKITSKTEWMEESNIRIVMGDGSEVMNMGTSIRGRGNSTWGFPKKPYALKLDSKSEVLGMPKHKRWVLLANWLDRTLLRNDIAFEMGRRIMEWAPRGQFVELYLNGVHQGNYYLCEQIKPDQNRVDIDDDGYILEFDDYGPNDEINYFYSPVMNYPVTIKEPDEEVITSWEHPMFLYIHNYVGDVERLLDEDQNTLSRWSELQDMLDIRSYIDWWLIHELTGNTEPVHPKSSYMFKKDGGKLYAGPVWDFDWQTFSWRPSGPVVAEFIWYRHLFRYEEFRAAVKERWSQTKDIYIDIDAYISSQAELIRSSNEVNIAKWPITMNVNDDYDDSFDKAISMMRSRYDERIKVIDNYISEF